MSVKEAFLVNASTPQWSIEKKRTAAQKALLGMTAVCAILASIPPLRLGASLAMRSVSLLSVGISKTPEGQEGPFVKAAKLATVALGIVALAASMPMLMIASLAADIGLQIIEGARAIYQGDFAKAAMHATILVIDTLALAGLIVGSWQLMIAAASVSAAAMLVLASVAGASGHVDEMFAYWALMGANIATTFTIGESTRTMKTVVIKNDDPNGKMIVMKPVGPGIVAESAPGQDVVIHDNSYGRYNVIHVSQTGETRTEVFHVPEEIHHGPISCHDMPQLALGGNVLKSIEPSTESLRKKGLSGPFHF